ncbi:MAG: hypothetical protein ACTSQE_16015 [Candidatus Heimdallarchaeaceae archaeon]
MDFTIQSLSFCRYEVEDGTILRILNVPIKIFRLAEYDQQGFPEYIIQNQNIVSALVPQELRGEPSKEPFNPNKERMNLVDFVMLKEPINTFELADGTKLRTRLIVNHVYKADKRNGLGEPIYVIKSNVSITKKVPEHLRRQ